MANYTSFKYVINTTPASTTTASYTCLKDSTAIVVVTGTQYISSGNVLLNGNVIFSYDKNVYSPKYMEFLDVKEGDVITFNLLGSNSGYRMFGFIVHEDGAF